MKVLHLVLAVLVVACSAKNRDLDNQTKKGHHELYSRPDAPEKAGKKLKRVVVAATNDLHGQYGHQTIKFEDKQNKGKQEIKLGGVDYIASYFKILRQEYGNVVLVDSGDILPDLETDLEFTRKFYQELNYDAVTFGLSDFNLPAQKNNLIKDFAATSRVPVLLSNLYELKTARAVEWDGIKPYEIKEFNGIKVGILGIVPNDIVTLTPVDNRVGLYVESMIQNTLYHARLVRSLGAQLVVVLTHHGVSCGEKIAKAQKLPITKVNFEPEREDMCEMNGVLGEYLTRLPPHLVDVVVGGRHHQKMANVYNGVVLLSGFPDGKGFNYAEFYFDSSTNKLLKDKTIVRQPVMFCHQFFKETDDCYTEDASIDHKPKVPAEFLDSEVKPDEVLKKKFEKFFIPKTALNQKPNIEHRLKQFSAELVYLPRSTKGVSQLVTIEMTGKELARRLEESYNEGKKNRWFPSPYISSSRSLKLSVSGSPIDHSRTYRILADLESLQSSRHLKKFISQHSTRSSDVSWNTSLLAADEVKAKLSSVTEIK